MSWTQLSPASDRGRTIEEALAVLDDGDPYVEDELVAEGSIESDEYASQSAEVIFPVAFFLAVIFWTAREARRHADAWVAGAMVGLAFFVVALGNLRVIWAISGDSWTDAQAGALGSARPGFDSGHSLVEIGTTAGVAAIVLFIAVLRTHRIVRTGPDRKSTRLNSSHIQKSRMPSSA